MKPKKKTRTDGNLADLIRQTFVKSGISRFEWARRAGVSYSLIHRFAGGDRGINLTTADKLLAALDVEARIVKRKG